MNAIHVLIEHHELLRSLMDRVGAAEGIERRTLLDELPSTSRSRTRFSTLPSST